LGLAAAIIGLALLVLIHEAGHFFAARAVGMTPRKFYIGFGPPIAKVVRGKVEYGIGSLPLGGYVKIPGMSRPSPGELKATLQPEAREQHRAELARLDAALERGDYAGARAELEELRPALGESRYVPELAWSLDPDAYWRQATWRRLVAIFAGPAVNLFFAFVLFAVLFMVATTRETNVIGRVQQGSPAAAAGLHAGDRVLAVAGRAQSDLVRLAHHRRQTGAFGGERQQGGGAELAQRDQVGRGGGMLCGAVMTGLPDQRVGFALQRRNHRGHRVALPHVAIDLAHRLRQSVFGGQN
jgi:regulator of sigma E protease